MGHPGTLGMTKWGFALPRNVVADGWVERKSSGNLISYAPTRLNLFHKIQAEKPCLPANLTALEPGRSEQQHVRDAIGSEGHRREDFVTALFWSCSRHWLVLGCHGTTSFCSSF